METSALPSLRRFGNSAGFFAFVFMREPSRCFPVKSNYFYKYLKNMVEAAGVEPASLPNKPAATTCLVRRESQPPDNDLTRIRRSSLHENFSAERAQTPRST